MLLARLRHLIRSNRSNVIVVAIATFCTKYLRAYYNEGYFDMRRNGEMRVIQKASEYFNGNLIALDIGANQGSWAEAVLNTCPNSEVFCFEIVPETAAKLKARLESFSSASVFNIGLSSQRGEVDVYWNKTSSDTSAIIPRHSDPLFANAIVEKIRCQVEDGDSVVGKLKISRIDLLKIDVEGHEVSVLKGFRKTLSDDQTRPSMIQFEYGETYIPGGHNLFEVYQILEPYGYVIGRIYPNGVEFKAYKFADDHFRMGNYLAVHVGSNLQSLLRSTQ